MASKFKKPQRSGLPPRGGTNMNNLQSQMLKLQEEMAKAEELLAEEEVTATSGGGMVTVVVTGKQVIKSITVKPEAVDPEDVELLQDMVLAAVNEALEMARNLESERMGELTGGVSLPPGISF